MERAHRYEIFVPTKDVGDFDHMLLNFNVQVVVRQPVANAAFQNGVVVAANSGNNLCEKFIGYLSKHPEITELTALDVGNWCRGAGYAKKGARYTATACGIKHGFLKRVGKGTNTKWLVTLPKNNKKK